MSNSDTITRLQNLPDLVKAVPLLAFGGICFAVGNLFLAEAMPPADFGNVVLYLVFIQLAHAIAPLGAETLTIRRLLPASRILLARVATSSVIVSVMLSLITFNFYHLPGMLSIMLFGNCLLAGLTRVGAAVFQANHRVLTSISFLQIHNIFIVMIGAVALLSSSLDSTAVCALISLGYIVTTLYAWRPSNMSKDASDIQGSWKEGLALVSVGMALLLLMQLERLVIPQALNISELALFAVCAAIYLAPFRMYQLAVYYVLPTRIRREELPELRKNIVYSEIYRSTIICAFFSGVLWLVGPLIIALFNLDHYQLDSDLVVAALISGIVKVFSTIGTVAITVTGTKQDLSKMSAASWVILITSLPFAIFCSRWGTTGVIISVALSWAIYGTVGFVLQLKNINRSLSNPV